MTEKIILEVKNLEVFATDKNESKKLLNKVSFILHEGERLGVIGDSGAGKSMLMMSIMGMLPESMFKIHGEIIYYENGEKTDLLKFGRKQMRKFATDKMNMILQDSMNILNPYMTISSQMADTLIYKEKMSKKQAYEQTTEILKKLNISDAENRINDYPYRFSGGMKQRMGIYLSLIGKSKILIADEPTTSLDVINQEKILAIIENHIKENNTALIYISHDLNVISKMTDRIIVMKNGEISQKK